MSDISQNTPDMSDDLVFLVLVKDCFPISRVAQNNGQSVGRKIT